MLQKPNFGDPDYDIPSGFATTNSKSPFDAQDIIDGYGTIGSLGLIPTGANYNHTLDLLFKWFTFFNTAIRVSSGTPNGSLTAEVGTVCLDNVNGKVYKKKSGTGNTGWIDLEAGSIPIGAYMPHAGLNLPTGFLWCDGTSYDTTTYPDLYTEIAYTYGNDSGKFRVPNLTKRIPIGLDSTDTDFDTLGKTGGVKTVTLTQNQIPSHNHTVTVNNNGSHIHTASNDSQGGHTHTATVSSTGGHTHTATEDSQGSHTHAVSASSSVKLPWAYRTIDFGDGGIYNHGLVDQYGSTTTISFANFLLDANGGHAHNITVNSVSDHTHTVSLTTTGSHVHTITVGSNGDHNHTASSGLTGGNESHSNIQPYTVTRYIIRAY